MSEQATFRKGIYKNELVRKFAMWLDASPHPPVAVEIATDRIAGARLSRAGGLDGFAVEPLPPGSIVPSAVETNLTNIVAVKNAFESVCTRLRAKNEDVAILVPDPVVRVFVQHFDDFPRSPLEAKLATED